jgi:hypothetical protein
MVSRGELRHNRRMRLFVVVAFLAACGVEIDGERKGVPVGDAQPQADAAIDAPPSRPCTGGDQAVTSGGQCYVLFTTTKRTWADANTACVGMQARLAVLDTAAKHTAAKALAGANDVWIGLTDVTAEGTYRWVDASVPFAFSMWNTNEPSNGLGMYEEDCTVIAGASAREWDDRPCSPAIANAPAGCCTYAYMCQY